MTIFRKCEIFHNFLKNIRHTRGTRGVHVKTETFSVKKEGVNYEYHQYNFAQ